MRQLKLLLNLFSLAISAQAFSAQFSCFEKDEINQVQMAVSYDSREPRLSFVYAYEDRSGREVVSAKDLVSRLEVCGENMNAKTSCRFQEKERGALYSLEYSCQNGNRGYLHFDEAGALEFQCNDSRKLTKVMSAIGCKRVR